MKDLSRDDEFYQSGDISVLTNNIWNFSLWCLDSLFPSSFLHPPEIILFISSIIACLYFSTIEMSYSGKAQGEKA